VQILGNPETDADAARQVVVNVVTSTIIGDAVFGETVGEGADLRVTTQRFVDDCVERMAPRDPVEELLISQLLLTHGRVVRLSHLAQQKLSYDEIRNLNELADRASNTYRKLMLALAEYRRPARGSSITAIQQANIANEQVVMKWMGHSPQIAAKHYLQVRDSHFDDAAGLTRSEGGAQAAHFAAQSCAVNRGHLSSGEAQIPASAWDRRNMTKHAHGCKTVKVTPGGFEPPLPG
jgi:hypothetical protein